MSTVTISTLPSVATARQTWENLAYAWNSADIDPTIRFVEFPMELHDAEYGVRYEYDMSTETFSWTVFNVRG